MEFSMKNLLMDSINICWTSAVHKALPLKAWTDIHQYHCNIDTEMQHFLLWTFGMILIGYKFNWKLLKAPFSRYSNLNIIGNHKTLLTELLGYISSRMEASIWSSLNFKLVSESGVTLVCSCHCSAERTWRWRNSLAALVLGNPRKPSQRLLGQQGSRLQWPPPLSCLCIFLWFNFSSNPQPVIFSKHTFIDHPCHGLDVFVPRGIFSSWRWWY